MLNNNKDTVKKKVSKIKFGWSVASTVSGDRQGLEGYIEGGTSQPSILRCARRDEGGSTQRGSGGE